MSAMRDKTCPRIIIYIFLSCLLWAPAFVGAQKGSGHSVPPAVAVESQINQKSGMNPEQALQLKEASQKGQLRSVGSLTPEEIRAGKTLLEKKMKGAEGREKIKPETDAPDPSKSEGEPPKAEEEFFKKISSGQKPVLKIYGHELFSRPPSTFAPITAFPVSNDYVIGPGDEISVLMWGRLDAEYLLGVDAEGVIHFPKIGPLTVAGLTYSELKARIKRKAEAITGVNVNVSMGKLRTIQVFVLGEVKSPGVYTVSSLGTIVNALLSSGGPTSLGSLRRVQLKRKGKVVTTIDLYDFLLKGDTSGDRRLMPGDVIFIPQVGPQVSVSGNVRRPAVYELNKNKDLKTALKLAGGLSPHAYNQRIQIERFFKNQIQIVLDITSGELQRKKPVLLQDGDVVSVFSILPTSVNAVYLHGNVLRPGKYAFKQGLRLMDILPDLNSLDVDTHFDYALVKRYRPTDMKTELIPFDLGKLLLSKDERENLPLKPLDEVYVFSRWMFEDKPFALVEGEVRKPGRYLIDEMKVRDLIQRAGDLTAEAHLRKAELIRTDRNQTRRTIYFDVAMAMADDPNHNLDVMDKDRIIIHSIWEEQWKEYVTIEGEVKKPGEYFLTQGLRLKDLIFKAGHFTRDAFKETGHIYRTGPGSKEVTIHTFNVGKVLEGDPDHNLILYDLDRVMIHNIWEYIQKYNVSIRGEVNRPGDYPYATNMTVRDLLLVGGNVKDSGYLEQAELVRFEIVEGKKVKISVLNFNVRQAMERDPNHDLKLKPLDAVYIKQIPEWGETKKVAVTGEVSFPGTYNIRKDERLSSIISRAGGITDLAYFRGAVFTRESVRETQQKRLNEMLERLQVVIARVTTSEAQASLTKEDLARQEQVVAAQEALINRLKGAKATGRIVIALTPLPVFRGSPSDLILEDGDNLHIPTKGDTVNVLGEVYNPISLIFDADKPELQYYLKKTGGPTENAEKDQMYVIRADGSVTSKKGSSGFQTAWISGFEQTRLYPGDTVLVPQKVIYPNRMRDIKDITQIIFQIAVTAGILITQVF